MKTLEEKMYSAIMAGVGRREKTQTRDIAWFPRWARAAARWLRGGQEYVHVAAELALDNALDQVLWYGGSVENVIEVLVAAAAAKNGLRDPGIADGKGGVEVWGEDADSDSENPK
ncbi:MAG: hypothetical protein QW445_03435 [Candidatus Bathyarchaeia archaeon]